MDRTRKVTTPTSDTAVLAGAAGVAIVLCAVTVGADGTMTAQVAYFVGVIGSAALALAGSRRHGQRLRVAWTSIGLGLALTAAADLVWEYDVWRLGADPDASLADIGYLASYVLLAVGLFRLPAPDRRGALDVGLDSAMAGVLALLAVWQISLVGIIGETGASPFLRALWSAYPVLDVVLLTLVVRLLLGRSTRPGVLFASGVIAWLVADLGFLVTAGEGAVSAWLDCGWLVASISMGTAALLSTPKRVTPGPPPAAAWLGPPRSALITVPLLVPATVELIAKAMGTDADALPMFLASLAMAALVFVRLTHAGRAVDRSRRELESSERRARALATHASDAVVVLSPRGRPVTAVDSVSAFLDRVMGSDPSATDLASRMAGDDPRRVHVLLGRALLQPGEVATDEWALDGPTGTAWVQARAVSLVDDPDVNGVVVNLLDVTARKHAEEELTRQALYDSLTGLANRVLFRERLDHAVLGRRRGTAPPVVLYLDLDGFKAVNDSLGHDAGDELLRTVADRLVDVVRSHDTVARLGGDEFAILLDAARQPTDEAMTVATRVLQTLSTPTRVQDRMIVVSASIGIAAPDDGDSASTLLRNADIAMYEAKSAGRARAVVFEPGMGSRMDDRLQLELDLAAAVAEEQLRLVYQPVVDLETDRVVGLEALLRWEHPTLGMLRPDRFIPIAEDCGLILPIGHWVLETACAALAAWRRASPRWDEVTMAVNVSARQLAAPAFVDEVSAVLDRTGLPASRLVLEVTESMLVEDVAAAALRLHALRDLGVRVAIDDFGTGYSSLGYLRQFPLDILKVDRSFTATITASDETPPLVRGLLDLAARLGLETVAEGVEDEVQRAALQAAGCRLGQGYLLGAPLPGQALRAWLDRMGAGPPRSRSQAAATPNSVPIA